MSALTPSLKKKRPDENLESHLKMLDIKAPRLDWRSILLSGSLIGAVVIFGTFAYNTWYNIPIVTYELLPAYPASPTEQVAGVIVRNEGRKGATDVRIVIEGSGQISILPTRIQEESKQTTQDSKAIITLPRLPQGAQISVFLKVQTQAPSPITDVYVSFVEGIGTRRTATQDPFSGIRDLLAAIGGFIIFVLAVSAVSARIKKRTKAGPSLQAHGQSL